MKNGIELAKKDDPNRLSGINFIFEDTVYDPKLAVTSFKKLVSQDHVDLIYTWGTTFCKTLSPLAEQMRVPMVSQCVDKESAAGKKYVVRFMNHSDDYMKLVSNYLQHRDLNKIAVIVTENAFLEELLNALKRTNSTNQKIFLEERYRNTDMDFRPTIAKIRSSGVNVIGVFLSVGQVAQFYKQLKEQKITHPTFGTNLFYSLSEVTAAQGAMEGAIFPSNLVAEAFTKRFEGEFKNASQLSYAALAYEFGMFLGSITDHVGSGLNAETVLMQLTSIQSREGAAVGTYSSITTNEIGRYVSFPLVLKKIVGNKIIDLSSS